MNDRAENYYISNKPALINEFNKTTNELTGTLISHLDEPKIRQILDQTRSEFETLLPELPYIGNEDNVLAGSLVSAAWYLPLFQMLESEGMTVRDIGEIIYKMFARNAQSRPEEQKKRVRDFYFSPAMRDYEMKRTELSRSGKYPGDWVEEFIEGDGENFDFGINFTECAICKFLKPRGGIKYTSVFCLSDYANFHALDIGFKRTRTLPLGAPYCDFRFKKDWDTQSGWPPEGLAEDLGF